MALAIPLLILAGLAAAGQLEPLLVQSGLIRDTPAIGTLNGRLLIWQRAGYFLAQAPFTGIGLNQFRLAVPAFWPLASPLLHGDIGHAHNHFVHVAVEMGIPGLIAYAAIWLAAFRQVWAGLGTRRLPEFEMALLGSASSLVAFLVYGVFDTVALGARAGFPFWLFLALVFALTMPPAANEPPTV